MKKKKRYISTREFEKANTELQIMQVLKKNKGKLRWKNLFENIRKERNMKMSTRTLSDRLKGLEEAGLVRRLIDVKVYPPAVYYEITNQGFKNEFPFVMILDELRKVEDSIQEFKETTGIIKTYLEKNDPEKALEIISLNLLNNLLTTLNLCIGVKQEALPFIMDYNVKNYEINLKALVSSILKSTSLANAVKITSNNLKKERREKIKEYEDKFTAQFKDKNLAKALLTQFSVMQLIGEVKTLDEFLENIIDNEYIQKELEKREGYKIPKKRIENILKDPAWKTLPF